MQKGSPARSVTTETRCTNKRWLDLRRSGAVPSCTACLTHGLATNPPCFEVFGCTGPGVLIKNIC